MKADLSSHSASRDIPAHISKHNTHSVYVYYYFFTTWTEFQWVSKQWNIKAEKLSLKIFCCCCSFTSDSTLFSFAMSCSPGSFLRFHTRAHAFAAAPDVLVPDGFRTSRMEKRAQGFPPLRTKTHFGKSEVLQRGGVVTGVCNHQQVKLTPHTHTGADQGFTGPNAAQLVERASCFHDDCPEKDVWSPTSCLHDSQLWISWLSFFIYVCVFV